MIRHPEIPDLLEQYMKAAGAEERWVTVGELRSYFQMEESTGPAFSGFLKKIHQGPFVSCRYKVVRIEKFQDTIPPYRIIRKYLVRERPAPRSHQVPDARDFARQTR